MWKRVLAPTLLVAGIWIGVSIVTTIFLHWATELQRRFLAENVATIQTVAELENVLLQMQSLTLNREDNRLAESARRLDSLAARCEELVTAAQAAAGGPEDDRLGRDLHRHATNYTEMLRRRLARGTSPPEESDSLLTSLTGMSVSCQELLRLHQQLLADAVAQRMQMYRILSPLRTVAVVAGPVLGIFCGLWIARRVRHSIARISVTLTGDTGMDQEVGEVTLTPASDLPALEQQVRAVGERIQAILGELHRARQQLVRSERLAAVGQLAAGVAHELRNPLTSLKLLIQTATRRGPGAALDEKQAWIVQEEIARMENTIQGLLDFARPPTPKRVRHDLCDTVQRAVNLIEGRAKQRKVTIHQTDSDRPLIVDGDPEQIHQVLVNLLLNGIDAAGAGGQIDIQVSPQPAVQDAFCVVVRDSGRGIPDTMLDRLFEPFVTSKEWGTGLGLAISRRIAEEHGGTITAANRPAGGAQFTLQLPAAARPASSPSAAG